MSNHGKSQKLSPLQEYENELHNAWAAGYTAGSTDTYISIRDSRPEAQRFRMKSSNPFKYHEVFGD